MCLFPSTSLSLSLSLYIYIYIYIHKLKPAVYFIISSSTTCVNHLSQMTMLYRNKTLCRCDNLFIIYLSIYLSIYLLYVCISVCPFVFLHLRKVPILVQSCPMLYFIYPIPPLRPANISDPSRRHIISSLSMCHRCVRYLHFTELKNTTIL